MGSLDSLLKALHIVEVEGPKIGLHLNQSKSLLFIPPSADHSVNHLPPAIPTTSVGFPLLGCPIGPPEFCESIFQSRVNKVKDTLKSLPSLEDSQVQTTLIHSCLALPKVVSVLRACPPSHIQKPACDLDASLRVTLESILGDPLSDWSWLKASLPCRKGGLGLRSASLHSSAAFLDSSLHSAPLIEGLLGQSPPPPPPT